MDDTQQELPLPFPELSGDLPLLNYREIDGIDLQLSAANSLRPH